MRGLLRTSGMRRISRVASALTAAERSRAVPVGHHYCHVDFAVSWAGMKSNPRRVAQSTPRTVSATTRPGTVHGFLNDIRSRRRKMLSGSARSALPSSSGKAALQQQKKHRDQRYRRQEGGDLRENDGQ